MRLRLLTSLAHLLILSSCTQLAVATPEPTTLTVAGSTEMQPLLQELSAEFSRRNPGVRFDLRGGGSTLAERWLIDSQIDLAASTLVVDQTEVDPTVERIPIALDAISLFVHRDNPVAELTLLELRDIFSGRILRWSEVGSDVGGDEDDVRLVSREDGSGSRLLFEERVMGGESVALTAVVMPTAQAVVDYIAERPSAIGYASYAFISSDAEGARPVRAVPIEGATPDQGIVDPGRYHLSRPLYLVRRRDEDPMIRDFIDFVLSPSGQAIVGRTHGRIR